MTNRRRFQIKENPDDRFRRLRDSQDPDIQFLISDIDRLDKDYRAAHDQAWKNGAIALERLTEVERLRLALQEITVQNGEEARRTAERALRGSAPEPSAQSGWYPIDALDKSKPHFVLVHEDGAVRLLYWEPARHAWTQPDPPFGIVSTGLCADPTEWMPLPAFPRRTTGD